jgi:hypothetical protein
MEIPHAPIEKKPVEMSLGTGLDHQRVEVHPSLQDSCDVKSITILD